MIFFQLEIIPIESTNQSTSTTYDIKIKEISDHKPQNTAVGLSFPKIEKWGNDKEVKNGFYNFSVDDLSYDKRLQKLTGVVFSVSNLDAQKIQNKIFSRTKEIIHAPRTLVDSAARTLARNPQFWGKEEQDKASQDAKAIVEETKEEFAPKK